MSLFLEVFARANADYKNECRAWKNQRIVFSSLFFITTTDQSMELILATSRHEQEHDKQNHFSYEADNLSELENEGEKFPPSTSQKLQSQIVDS